MIVIHIYKAPYMELQRLWGSQSGGIETVLVTVHYSYSRWGYTPERRPSCRLTNSVKVLKKTSCQVETFQFTKQKCLKLFCVVRLLYSCWLVSYTVRLLYRILLLLLLLLWTIYWKSHVVTTNIFSTLQAASYKPSSHALTVQADY